MGDRGFRIGLAFDDQQGDGLRRASQAGPGNDINAGSPGSQKAPTRSPASPGAIRPGSRKSRSQRFRWPEPIGRAAGPPPRERILAVARELFYRHGIHAVGVDAIAEAAGTNKMTLYRHFASKDVLVRLQCDPRPTQ